jgi:hypothetical protein
VRLTRVAILVLLVATGCGADDTSAPVAEMMSCGGLADRWVRIQQDYLDRLDDADEVEFAEPSDRVNAAALWIGQAMLEQIRDSNSVGCDAELESGSPALCERVERLTTRGGAAAAVVEKLRDGCDSS